MTEHPSEARTILETELLFGVRRRERLAWTVAGLGVLTGLAGVVAVVALLPLKETQAFVAIVDKDTGIAERAVTVEHATFDQTRAVVEAAIYGYVIDRETYDEVDNEPRILAVYERSIESARSTLTDLWTEGNAAYPPDVYGQDARAIVKIDSITQLQEGVAQVRYTKTLTSRDGEKEGRFEAVIGYKFEPATKGSVELVWQNPFGFVVSDYRVSAIQKAEGSKE